MRSAGPIVNESKRNYWRFHQQQRVGRGNAHRDEGRRLSQRRRRDAWMMETRYHICLQWGNLCHLGSFAPQNIQLAKKGRFIHVRSQISWYVCSMHLGTKGDFFSYTCTFCAHLPRCCALLCGRPLSYNVCTVQFF
jgi:hypothetical protein